MNTDAPVSPVFFLTLFPVFFVAMWLGVTTLLAYFSGWKKLHMRFGGRPARMDDSVSFASASIGFHPWFATNYNSVLTVRVGSEGVGLSVFRLFAVASPPLLLPWPALRECRSWRLFGTFDRFRFVVADTGVIVTLRGRSAAVVRDAWFRWGAAAGAAPAYTT